MNNWVKGLSEEELYRLWDASNPSSSVYGDITQELKRRSAGVADDGLSLVDRTLKAFGANPDDVAKAVKGAPKLGNALAGLGVLADAGFGAYEAYNRDPYQDNRARTIEAIGAGAGSGLGGWGGALLGAKLGTVAGPIGTAVGTLAGAMIGSKGLGELGRTAADLFDRGIGDDGRKEKLKAEREERIQDQLDEMRMIAEAQQEIERENALFNQQLAQQARYEETLMNMIANASNNTGSMGAAQLLNAIYA